MSEFEKVLLPVLELTETGNAVTSDGQRDSVGQQRRKLALAREEEWRQLRLCFVGLRRDKNSVTVGSETSPEMRILIAYNNDYTERSQ